MYSDALAMDQTTTSKDVLTVALVNNIYLYIINLLIPI